MGGDGTTLGLLPYLHEVGGDPDTEKSEEKGVSRKQSDDALSTVSTLT